MAATGGSGGGGGGGGGGSGAAPVIEDWGKPAYRVLAHPALGHGLTASVHLAGRGGAPFALKRYATGKLGIDAAALASLKAAAAAEVGIWGALDHPHVAKCFGAVDVGDDICVALEFMAGASADARMRPPEPGLPKARLPVDVIAWVARDVARALAYLHGDPLGGGGAVLHRDIKPGNICFAADGAAKLTDFGSAALAREVKQRSKASGVGTAAFMAPEMHLGEKASAESDVWMFGATLLCLLTGEELAENERVKQSFNNVGKPWALGDHVRCELEGVNSEFERVPLEGVGLTGSERGFWEAAPEELRDLIGLCLRRKKAERLSAEALLAHPFVANVEANYLERRPAPPLGGLPRWPFDKPPPPPDAGMHIFVAPLGCEPTKLAVSSSDTIASVKAKVHEKLGFPVTTQRLVYQGTELANERTLAVYSVTDGSKIIVVTTLMGMVHITSGFQVRKFGK
jgi:serine/threonine protein kinase